MPRRKTSVKIKSLGAVDIHFHGAFGIDVMTAMPAELDCLARELRTRGVAAFCPTTLSVPLSQLREAVQRLGTWIAHRHKTPDAASAIPLGIHLEGPYLSPDACGAHPPQALRKLRLSELEALWEDSQGHLKILTIAPESSTLPDLKALTRWARKRQVILSLGHSRATEEEAQRAFNLGFSSVTHGWNALQFHQRSPGVMGAALGHPHVSIELILDQVHVSPTLMRWTRQLHGPGVCFVSDCVPAAATDGQTWHSFGNLRVRFKDGACRLKNGHLAGGGVLLPQAFINWVVTQARSQNRPTEQVLREELPGLNIAPLASLHLGGRLGKKPLGSLERSKIRLSQVEWTVNPDGSLEVRAL